MRIAEDEVIGELRYLTVEFNRTELVTGGMGVISQDAVKRYFIEKRPDLKVKKCGGLKLDSQRNIVMMRFGVVKERVSVTAIILDEFADKDNDYSAAQKLLNPGYDELLKEVRTLRLKASGREELSKKYDELKDNYDRTKKRYDLLISEFDELKEKYDALVIAHEKLLKEYEYVEARMMKLSNEKRETKMEIDLSPEDTADLAEAEEVLAEGDFVDIEGDDSDEENKNE